VSAYLVFGISETDLLLAKDRVEAALKIDLELRRSDYKGGDYYRLNSDDSSEYVLQHNFNGWLDDWAEPEHQEYGVILYAGEAKDVDNICRTLSGIGGLLRRTER
jgi:hypothetical protein